MVLLIVTHFKIKKGALFCYIYNFQIVKRLSISVSNPQIESPTQRFIAHLDENAVFAGPERYRNSTPVNDRTTVPSTMRIHLFLV
jgi:hypothetical protein